MRFPSTVAHGETQFEAILDAQIPLRLLVHSQRGTFSDSLRVEVHALTNRPSRMTTALLRLGEVVSFDDLYPVACLRQGETWARKGISALAINAAIAFVKERCAAETRISGHIYNAPDAWISKEYLESQQLVRKAFWRSFGIESVKKTVRNEDWMAGCVGDLRQSEGEVLGVSRVLDRNQFRFLPGRRPLVSFC